MQPLAPSQRQRLRRRHDAKLIAGVVDDPDFADADALVNADTVVAAGTSVESDKGLLEYLQCGGG